MPDLLQHLIDELTVGKTDLDQQIAAKDAEMAAERKARTDQIATIDAMETPAEADEIKRTELAAEVVAIDETITKAEFTKKATARKAKFTAKIAWLNARIQRRQARRAARE